MPKAPSKSAAAIQRLLEERRQYEAWLARITATADSAPEHVRTRVRADYEARLKAVATSCWMPSATSPGSRSSMLS